ncbi:hypothetical protein [Massilia sp. DWR3-1-1]|uniref:hypothetical protein n=1 Tax=Massilia sp. DWR3-1-1 TaxID=2804559 RepID=UPI003CF02DA5
MNTFNKAVSVHPPAPTYHERTDARSRDMVDHAIAVQACASTMSAVEYLKSHGVAHHVIERVLLEPQHRRSAVPA